MYINDYSYFNYHDYINPYDIDPCGRKDNIFLDLDGIPYLCAAYLDKDKLFPVQSSELKNDIFIDERDADALRTVVNVNIADFPYRGSDLYPYIVGNNRKYENLLNMTCNLPESYNHQFDVLLPRMRVQINYQLENAKTGQLMRSMVDNFDITDRNYAYYINPYDVTDNAILSNYTDTQVSAINHFTHGRTPMQFRITNIKLIYTMLDRDQYHLKPRTSNDVHFYHRHNQQDRVIYDDRDRHRHDRYHYDDPMPPYWSAISKFYHFDDGGHHIVLQPDEINHPHSKTIDIPCGRVFVNRTFLINPGQRIIFKFCIWKNDITVVDDTIDIAAAIKAPIDNCWKPCHKPMPIYPEFERPRPQSPISTRPDHMMIQEFEKNNRINRQQSEEINYNNKRIDTLIDAVNNLIEVIGEQHEDSKLPDLIENDGPHRPLRPADTGANTKPSLPGHPPMRPNGRPPHHHHSLEELFKLLNQLKDKLENDDECDHDEINDQIKDIQDEIDDIRTNGVDEATANRIKELESLIIDLNEELEKHMEEVPQPIPDEEVDELINKINEL